MMDQANGRISVPPDAQSRARTLSWQQSARSSTFSANAPTTISQLAPPAPRPLPTPTQYGMVPPLMRHPSSGPTSRRISESIEEYGVDENMDIGSDEGQRYEYGYEQSRWRESVGYAQPPNDTVNGNFVEEMDESPTMSPPQSPKRNFVGGFVTGLKKALVPMWGRRRNQGPDLLHPDDMYEAEDEDLRRETILVPPPDQERFASQGREPPRRSMSHRSYDGETTFVNHDPTVPPITLSVPSMAPTSHTHQPISAAATVSSSAPHVSVPIPMHHRTASRTHAHYHSALKQPPSQEHHHRIDPSEGSGSASASGSGSSSQNPSLARIRNLVSDVHALPWVSQRIADDYLPAISSSRSRSRLSVQQRAAEAAASSNGHLDPSGHVTFDTITSNAPIPVALPGGGVNGGGDGGGVVSWYTPSEDQKRKTELKAAYTYARSGLGAGNASNMNGSGSTLAFSPPHMGYPQIPSQQQQQQHPQMYMPFPYDQMHPHLYPGGEGSGSDPDNTPTNPMTALSPNSAPTTNMSPYSNYAYTYGYPAQPVYVTGGGQQPMYMVPAFVAPMSPSPPRPNGAPPPPHPPPPRTWICITFSEWSNAWEWSYERDAWYA